LGANNITSVLSSFNLSMFEHIHELISVKQSSSRFDMSIQFSNGSNTKEIRVFVWDFKWGTGTAVVTLLSSR
jgi:hypothetical protein